MAIVLLLVGITYVSCEEDMAEKGAQTLIPHSFFVELYIHLGGLDPVHPSEEAVGWYFERFMDIFMHSLEDAGRFLDHGADPCHRDKSGATPASRFPPDVAAHGIFSTACAARQAG